MVFMGHSLAQRTCKIKYNTTKIIGIYTYILEGYYVCYRGDMYNVLIFHKMPFCWNRELRREIFRDQA